MLFSALLIGREAHNALEIEQSWWVLFEWFVDGYFCYGGERYKSNNK